MKDFILGLSLGVFIAAGVAIYHTFLIHKCIAAFDEIEAAAKGEAVAAIAYLRKKLAL